MVDDGSIQKTYTVGFTINEKVYGSCNMAMKKQNKNMGAYIRPKIGHILMELSGFN